METPVPAAESCPAPYGCNCCSKCLQRRWSQELAQMPSETRLEFTIRTLKENDAISLKAHGLKDFHPDGIFEEAYTVGFESGVRVRLFRRGDFRAPAVTLHVNSVDIITLMRIPPASPPG